MSQTQDYDVVIVGAGMVGASLACALSRPGSAMRRVAVVEPATLQSGGASCQPGFDERSTALSAGSVRILGELGLWQTLSPQSAAIREIHVSDRGRFGATRLKAEEHGLEALGQVVENRWLGRAINAVLPDLPGVDLLDGHRVDLAQPLRQGYSLSLVNSAGEQQLLRARLLVLAEGGRSGLCEQLGIHRRRKDYGQVALVANVTTASFHDNVAYERFTEHGPVALLPLKPFERRSRSALIWTHPAGAETALRAQPAERLLQDLQQSFGCRLGRFERIGERLYWPLGLTVAEEQYRPGLVLLGNAAHSLHPVAGQGFNLALRAAMALAQQIRAAWHDGENPGDECFLRAFAESVSADQQRTIAFSDQLIGLFGASDPVRRAGRGLGLLGLTLLPSLRQSFARQAMGMGWAPQQPGKGL